MIFHYVYKNMLFQFADLMNSGIFLMDLCQS